MKPSYIPLSLAKKREHNFQWTKQSS